MGNVSHANLPAVLANLVRVSGWIAPGAYLACGDFSVALNGSDGLYHVS